MKLAIMQPYIFPYIGYFQLLEAADKFVFLDDVNYINRGWINRNNILINGKGNLFSVPLQNASQNKLINEILVAEGNWRDKLLKTIEMAYKKAPRYNDIVPLLGEVFSPAISSISDLAKESIHQVLTYLDLSKLVVESSSFYDNKHLKGEERILDISRIEKATVYFNPIGGTELYHKEKFAHEGIELRFLKTRNIAYKQWNNDFVPHLSIIDVLMFNEKESVRQWLTQYDLLN